MIALKKYQEEAVDSLVKDTYSLLKLPGARKKLVFKAPTGAGKTITMAAYLNKLCEELPDQLELGHRKIAFIWIAPNQLHLQSFNALKNYFAELRSLHPIQFEDITDNRIKPNEVLFLNWQSINKDGNLYIRENESDKTLVSYINQSRLHDTEVVVILDEAHLFAGKGKAAQDLLQKIYAKIEIDVSATPLFSSDYSVTIKRQDVVEAEMIKRGIILNPRLDAHEQQGQSLNQVLIELAMVKRAELAKAYRDMGVSINPLLLIQLPNDTQTESAKDNEIKEAVMAFLEVKGITTKNNRLAVWLSKDKINLDGIEGNESMVDVLLFKQAIALGWDCPRAAVLLIFREIQQETFTIQTVGRILRMPEQKHYTNTLLNYGYVYTNLSKNMIQIVQDELDYIVQNKALRIANYSNIALRSHYINTRQNRNRLSSRFKSCFYLEAEKHWKVSRDPSVSGSESLYLFNQKQLTSKFMELDVRKIEITIPKDVLLEGELGATEVNKMERFAKTQSELDTVFRQFCRDHIGAYAKVDSAPVLEMALKMFFEEYLGVNEFQAIKIMLYEQNRPRLIDIIDKALEAHEILQQQKAATAIKQIEESAWDVPPEKNFNDAFKEQQAPTHALIPFYQYGTASTPEKLFVLFLEKHKDHIQWWYKNGDKNKEDFAVTYLDRYGTLRGFYVDFVIYLKNGIIALFDTKTLNSDAEFVNKHNALYKYIKEQNTKGRKLMGGIIVHKGDDVWKYCNNLLSVANDTTGWENFDPALPNNL